MSTGCLEFLHDRVTARVSVAGALALAVVLAAVTPCLGAELTWPAIVETPTSRRIPGKWVWAELLTEDVNAAATFYGGAFGWSFRTFPAARGPGYTLALTDAARASRWASGRETPLARRREVKGGAAAGVL